MASLGLWIENGIAWVRELVADKITTKKLCLEENGEEICLTKTQLKELLEKNQTQIFPPQEPPPQELPPEIQ